MFKQLSRRLNVFHRHLSKKLFTAQNWHHSFFTARLCRDSHARKYVENWQQTKENGRRPEILVSHSCAIGDTISCDAPYSAIGFRGKLLLRYPPLC